MRIREPRVDWLRPSEDAASSDVLNAFHDGIATIGSDPRSRTVDFSFFMPHLARHDIVAPHVAFELRVSGASSMRASVLREFPEPFVDVDGESGPERSARVDQWHSLAQEVSIDWMELESAVRTGGMVIGQGALLVGTHGVAVQFTGSYPRTRAERVDPRPVRIVVAGSEIAWSRSDGVPWRGEQMRDLVAEYWRRRAVSGPARWRSPKS